MRIVVLCALAPWLSAYDAGAQLAVELSYGVDRNVESAEPELDGFVSGSAEWMVRPGLGLGVGTDHQFEGAGLAASDHLGWALYLSSSFEAPLGRAAPFVRAGVGVGRAPCAGDVCSDGAYLRGSAGVRVRMADRIRLSGEVGMTRVSRPFGVAGVSMRF